MSEAPMRYGMDKQLAVSDEQLALVKRTVFPGATDDELKLYVFECGRRGVHPLDRKIFPVKRNDAASGVAKVTFQTSIDLFRSEAEATGQYAGQEDIEYGPEKEGFPEWAKATVKKWISAPDGTFILTAISATARWKEFYPGEKLGFMWRKLPHLMLGKCAEAQAIRKAFPQKIGGLYAEEEMQRPEDGKGGASFIDTVQEKAAGPAKPAPQNATRAERSRMQQAAPRPAQQPQRADARQGGLGLGKGPQSPPPKQEDHRPANCTKSAQQCSMSSYVDNGDGLLKAVCSADGQECGYPQEA